MGSRGCARVCQVGSASGVENGGAMELVQGALDVLRPTVPLMAV
jgi:hypothetical protein